MSGKLLLAIPRDRRALFSRAVDAEFMRAVFQRELPPLARTPIAVAGCKAKPAKSRTTMAEKMLRVVYHVALESPEGRRWQRTMVGTVPVGPEALNPELLALCREAQDHPAAEPFRELAFHVAPLSMAFWILPVDPALPGLAHITGRDGVRQLAACLADWAGIERLDSEMRHYKPSKRCVLRLTARLSDGRTRCVYAKIFADDCGELQYRNMKAVWEVARCSRALRTPEPLGYDPRYRMLVMTEAPGSSELRAWINCLEKNQPLPEGVNLERLERCMAILAEAISELQRSGIRASEERSFHSDLAGLHRGDRVVRDAHPALAAEIQRVLQRLEAETVEAQYGVPAHGGFRHRQTTGDDRCLTIFDWDGLCLADPALDAATFLAHLRREPLHYPGNARALEHLAGVFRTEFLRRTPMVSGRRLARYEALALTQRAVRSFRRRHWRSESRVEEVRRLVAGADRLLQGGDGEV